MQIISAAWSAPVALRLFLHCGKLLGKQTARTTWDELVFGWSQSEVGRKMTWRGGETTRAGRKSYSRLRCLCKLMQTAFWYSFGLRTELFFFSAVLNNVDSCLTRRFEGEKILSEVQLKKTDFMLPKNNFLFLFFCYFAQGEPNREANAHSGCVPWFWGYVTRDGLTASALHSFGFFRDTRARAQREADNMIRPFFEEEDALCYWIVGGALLSFLGLTAACICSCRRNENKWVPREIWSLILDVMTLSFSIV